MLPSPCSLLMTAVAHCCKLGCYIRIAPCGHGGLQHHFLRVSLQALRFAYSLLGARAVAASPRIKGNKNRSHTTPLLPWAMADCAFSKQRKVVYQRPSVVNNLLRAESDIKPSSRILLANPFLGYKPGLSTSDSPGSSA
jgi:hypothetical protein